MARATPSRYGVLALRHAIAFVASVGSCGALTFVFYWYCLLVFSGSGQASSVDPMAFIIGPLAVCVLVAIYDLLVSLPLCLLFDWLLARSQGGMWSMVVPGAVLAILIGSVFAAVLFVPSSTPHSDTCPEQAPAGTGDPRAGSSWVVLVLPAIPIIVAPYLVPVLIYWVVLLASRWVADRVVVRPDHPLDRIGRRSATLRSSRRTL
jgi:hypothetical protein